MHTYIVKKTLNNNVLIATDTHDDEVVLIGKGLGFRNKKDDVIQDDAIEKLFVLRNTKEQQHYQELLPHIDQDVLHTIISATELIRHKSKQMLNEHVHVALTDHLVFAIHRLSKGLTISNPFLSETKILYPGDYKIAEEVVALINQSMNIKLPEGEIGFIALHIHSAIVNKNVSEINTHTQLITLLVSTIEEKLAITLDKNALHYIRLIQHIRYTIERVIHDEMMENPETIEQVLKVEYPVCYNLAWQLMKIIQHTLKKPVHDAEAVYLTMHLQRLSTKQQ